MAHLSLNQYLQQTETAWRNQDGNTVADYLSFRHAHVASSKLQLENPESSVERVLGPPLDEIVAAHLRAVWAVNNQDFVEAYRCQTLVVQSFTKVLQAQRDENWSLPVMYTVCVDLRLMAVRADPIQTAKGGRLKEAIEKAAESLLGCFRVCAADNRSSEENTKRWGMLALVNQLIKVYFHINKLHLCKPLIRAVDSSAFKDLFPIGQRVTYRYYTGRKAMFDSDYRAADEYLTFAFERCHKSSKRNKQRILLYLIPVKMLLGYMPKISLLKKYDLTHLLDIVEAVKQGNVTKLNNCIQENQSYFINCGIYLLLEKLRNITYRNLFKKVYLIMQKHQIPMEALATAFRFLEVKDLDMEEIQCIVSNLIFDNKIKGYISITHKKLVVSKQNAFPSLVGVL